MKSKSEEIASVRWNNHRVFFYALVARILLSFHWVPPRWISYLINNAALRSVVAHPWWTTAYMREYWANQTWETGNECDAKIFAVPILLDNLAPLVLMAVDYAIAHYLYQLASRRDANIRQQEIDLQTKVMPEAIQPPKSLLDILSSIPSYVWPLAYFANPAMILSTAVYGCFVNVKLLCLLVACYHFFTEAGAETKVTARARLSMAVPSVALALAVYLDVSWIVFLLALPEIWDSTLLTYSILQSIHLLTTGGIHGIWIASIGTIRSVPPSLSVLWYTKMELFARFIPSLQIMLGYLPFIVFAPLAMRLNRYPLALIAIYWVLLHTTCQPISTLNDFIVGVLLMLLSPSSCARMQQIVTMVGIVGVGVPVSLYMVLHPLWLVSNAGEANFLFFQCLAYQILVANVLLQFVTASLQRDKALRMTAKEIESDTKTTSPTISCVNAPLNTPSE